MSIEEKIICAAIWYKDFPLVKDDINSIGFERPINCDRGMVFCGHRHHNCMYQMIAITGKYQHEMGEEVQGFLTNKNRFVNRKEAAIIHKANGGTIEYSSDKLFSEDLY
jgi:hypothetical protein